MFSSSHKAASYDKSIKNMLINKQTKVVCQGFTGKQVKRQDLMATSAIGRTDEPTCSFYQQRSVSLGSDQPSITIASGFDDPVRLKGHACVDSADPAEIGWKKKVFPLLCVDKHVARFLFSLVAGGSN